MLRLDEVLKKREKSQIWMAERLGIGKSAMNNLVKGRSNPSLPKLYEIAKILECSVYDLIEPNEYKSIFEAADTPTAHGSDGSTIKRIEILEKEVQEIKETINQ